MPPPLPATFRAAFERETRSLNEAIRREVIQPAPSGGAHIAPLEVERYLLSCHDLTYHRAIALASSRSTTEWLCTLRSLPLEFVGTATDRATGSHFEHNLAETIASIGGLECSPVSPDGRRYPERPDDAILLGTFLASVSYLRGVDWLLRCNARDVRMFFRPGDQLPYDAYTQEQREGTSLYVRRANGAGNRTLARAGVLLAKGRRSIAARRTEVLGVARIRPTNVTINWAYEDGHLESETMPALFAVSSIDLAEVAAVHENLFGGNPAWLPDGFFAAVLCMRLFVDLVNGSHSAKAAHQFGFLSFDTGYFEELIAPRMPQALEDCNRIIPSPRWPLSPAALMHHLRDRRGSVRPLTAGRVAHVDGELTIIDLAAAFSLFDRSLSGSAEQGRQANLRAKVFETQVQALVDRTRWKPKGAARELVGKVIRQGGKDLTDLDAVGVLGNVLLIVSAKSRVSVAGLDAGNYQPVRNAAAATVQATEEALRLQDALTAQPVGDNFDLSGYARIAVVVCTPYAVYVPGGIATREVLPGLLAAVSLFELDDFLESGDALRGASGPVDVERR
jgi:hypothetical protein